MSIPYSISTPFSSTSPTMIPLWMHLDPPITLTNANIFFSHPCHHQHISSWHVWSITVFHTSSNTLVFILALVISLENIMIFQICNLSMQLYTIGFLKNCLGYAESCDIILCAFWKVGTCSPGCHWSKVHQCKGRRDFRSWRNHDLPVR